MILGWPNTFLPQGQICVPSQNVEKSFSENVFKTTNDWNLQTCMIEAVKLFNDNQTFYPPSVICSCLWAINMYKMV